MRTRPLDVIADPDAFGRPAHRLTDADIVRLEAATGATVPPRLRELFVRAGGALILAYHAGANAVLRDVDAILGNDRADDDSVFEQLERDDLVPPGMIPFAADGGGNLFRLRRDGCVVWLAHDGLEGDVGEIVAASLDEWLSSLVVEDESAA